MSKKIDVLSLKGEKVKDIKLEDNIFNIEPNDAVVNENYAKFTVEVKDPNGDVISYNDAVSVGQK